MTREHAQRIVEQMGDDWEESDMPEVITWTTDKEWGVGCTGWPAFCKAACEVTVEIVDEGDDDRKVLRDFVVSMDRLEAVKVRSGYVVIV